MADTVGADLSAEQRAELLWCHTRFICKDSSIRAIATTVREAEAAAVRKERGECIDLVLCHDDDSTPYASEDFNHGYSKACRDIAAAIRERSNP